jgi:nucleoid DNA-binding protein
MNKLELVKAVAKDSGLKQKDVDKMLASLETVFVETLEKGEEVKLVGFMTLKPVARAARKGRNPGDNTLVLIPEKVDVFVKPGKLLKDAVSELKYDDFK